MGDLVTASAIIATSGTGTWLADRLLGPSFDALGEQFRAFAGNRLGKIFAKAEPKVDRPQVEALPPGFAYLFLQRASISEDEDVLTDLWANLLARAATDFESRHVAFVEILSQLTAFDALQLEKLFRPSFNYHQAAKPVNLTIGIKRMIITDLKNTSETEEEARLEFQRLLNLDFGWPGKVTSARLFFKHDGEETSIDGGIADQNASYDNLRRLGLLEAVEVSNSMSPYLVAVEGVVVTMLGVQFMKACRGVQ